jgi:hypothetical protein
VLAGHRRALPARDEPGVEVDRELGVRVAQADQRPGLGDGDAELLAQLARECCARVLAPLDLAARKFPLARVDLVGRALADEDPATLVAQRAGGDMDEPRCGIQR